MHDALLATTRKQSTENHLPEVMDEVENSPILQRFWLLIRINSSMQRNKLGQCHNGDARTVC